MPPDTLMEYWTNGASTKEKKKFKTPLSQLHTFSVMGDE